MRNRKDPADGFARPGTTLVDRSRPSVAIVHDYLTQRGGAERVALSMLRAFPGAPLYTALYEPATTFPEFADHDVRPMWTNRLGSLRRDHRRGLPLYARAFAGLHVDADLVLCSSSGFAHGARTRGRKVVYCYTPPRWLYDQAETYLAGWPTSVSTAVRAARPAMRQWDRQAASTADCYLTSSTVVRTRIRDAYGIEATVVPPPAPSAVSGARRAVPGISPGYVLCVSRLLTYKNVDAVVAAFQSLPDARLVVIGDGPERGRLQRAAGSNVSLLGCVDDAELAWLYAHCVGVVAASYEDFGLTAIEATSCGKPVAALRAGGFLDTVLDGETGLYFEEAQAERIALAIGRLCGRHWAAAPMRRHAENFTEEAFADRLTTATRFDVDTAPSPRHRPGVAIRPAHTQNPTGNACVATPPVVARGGATTEALRTNPGRVLLLGDGWSGDRPGGLNRYFANLLGGLQEIGVEARAVVLGPAHDAPSTVTAAGGYRQPLPIRLWRFQRATRHDKTPAAVVDAHFALNALWPVVFGGLRRAPLVVHFQGPWAQESTLSGEHSVWRVRIKRLIETSVYHRATRVVVLSNAFKKLLIECYSVEPWRIEVVRPGVDLERFQVGNQAAARTAIGVAQDSRVALAVRRLVPRMGLDVLLEAWALLQPTVPGALLLIVGEGPERSRLETSAAQLGVTASVRFLGMVDDSTLLNCYQAADVSVVPTTALEGFGLIVLEALACGTPVISTNVDALPEVLAPLDPGLIVPSSDPPALAQILGPALGGTVPLPGPARCRSYAESFSWERVARRHERIYHQARRPSQTKLRVVYLDHCAQLSGGELALLRLIPALTDVDAHVILAEDGPLVTRLLHAGISVEVKPMAEAARGLTRDRVRPGMPLRTAVTSITYVARLARHLRRLRPDLVHTNSLKAAIYGGLASRIAGVPVVWHVRDRIASDYLPPVAVGLVRMLSRRLPTTIIANSESTLASLGETSTPTAVVSSPVGPDLRRDRQAARVDRRGVRRDVAAPVPLDRRRALATFEERTLRVGIVGRLAPWKGQHLFLDAFAAAFPDGLEVAVIVGGALFGDVACADELRRHADRLGLADRVEFTGFREDVGAELSRLDIVVHASTIPEPFGQVVVEAMAMGVPVVAADAGGPAEVIEHGVTGLLYPMGDAVALASTLRRLAGDTLLRHGLALAAQTRALDFRPEVIAGQVMTVYRRTLGERWPQNVPVG